VPEGAGSGTRGAWFPRWFWPSFAAPATLWLIVFFVVPFYVILAIAFGQLDQIFLTPIPVYNPLHWNANEVSCWPSGSAGRHAQALHRLAVDQDGRPRGEWLRDLGAAGLIVRDVASVG
jgi:hypothetical protein